MSVGYAKLELTKGNKMTNYEKLEVARKLLETKMDREMAYATMYGYLAVLVNSEKQADFVLALAQKRVG
jgi:hypothetical protein